MQIQFNSLSLNTDSMQPGAGLFPGMDGMAAARCGACDPMGGMGMNPMGGMGFPMSPGIGNTQFLMQMVGMLTMMLVSNMMRQQAMGGSSDAGGTSGVDASGGSSGSSGSSPVDTSGGSTAASGSNAVDLGRKFLGQNSIDIKGKLPKFTAAGGQTNNCADFVSSLLENAGTLKGHFVNVRGLEGALKQQGWRQIPAAQAKPGDVWMNHSRGHVELVTQAGGTKTIGSNNDRPGHQVISERPKNPSSGIYYTKG